jgi:hypothetical protein
VGSVERFPPGRCRRSSNLDIGRMLAFIERCMYRHQGRGWIDGCRRMVIVSKVE